MAAADAGRAIALYRQRQFEPAVRELRAVLGSNPRDLTARLCLARTLIELQRIPEALTELEKALEESTDPEVSFQAGQILRELAERRFAALEQTAPDSGALRELAARRLEMNGDLAAALMQYRAAAALEPGRPGIHYLLGNVMWRMRDLDAAEAELRAELASSPHHAMASLRLGQILVVRNREADAVALLERAVSAMPDSVEARRDLGKAYRKLRRTAEARREWEAVVKARPEDDQVHYLLGNLYRDLGETALARREIERHRDILQRRRARAEDR